MDNTPNLSRLFQTAGQQKQQQGTGFTNLNRIMQANQGNQLGQQVAGNIQQQIGNVKTQLGQQQQQFQTEAEKNKLGGEKDVQQREAVLGRFESPSSAGQASDEDVKAFERFRSGQYTGPQSLKDTGALKSTAQQIQGQVSNLSPSGTQELLRRTIGGNRYTQGQQGLDALLMNRQSLTPVQRQASGLGQEIGRADVAASGQAELLKNQAKQFAQETEGKLQTSMQNIDTSVQGQLKAAQDAEKLRQQRISDIAYLAQGQRGKVDEQGNPVIDPNTGKQVMEFLPQDAYKSPQEKMDALNKMMLESGLDQSQVSQIFGQGNLTQALANRSKGLDTANINRLFQIGSSWGTDSPGKVDATIQEIGKQLGISGPQQLQNATPVYNPVTRRYEAPMESEAQYQQRVKQAFDKSGKSFSDIQGIYDQLNKGYYAPTGRFGTGMTYVPEGQKLQDIMNTAGLAGYGDYDTARQSAINAYNQQTGKAGQALLGGSSDSFMNRLAQSLQSRSGSTEGQAQNLTEQGVASDIQRQNYEALNKLLGKQQSESKYRTDEKNKYKAGRLLIDPSQL